MNSSAVHVTERSDPPTLRLMPTRGGARRTPAPGSSGAPGAGRPAPRVADGPIPQEHPVLVAGGDSAGRAAILHDLTQTMPPSTTFAEASAFWEVLVRAPDSSMVILSGALDDLPAESLMQMLGHRHPGLPVVSLDPPAAGVEADILG